MHRRHVDTALKTSINANNNFFSLTEKNKFNHFYTIESTDELLQQVKLHRERSLSVNMVCFSHSSLTLWLSRAELVINVHCGFFSMSVSHGECSYCLCHQARARILKGCWSFLNVSLESWPPLSILGSTYSHTVQRLTQIPGNTERGGETQGLLSVWGEEKRQNMQHFLLFGFSIFFHCSSYLVSYHIGFQRLVVSLCVSQ